METEQLKAKYALILRLQAQLLEQNRKFRGNTFQPVHDVLPNSSLTERENELAVGFKKYEKGKNGLPVLQRKQKGKENLSKPCEQLFCCMMKKWHSICSVSYYRDWSSREMSAELEKVFKGLDICGGYCLCVKSGKFLKHFQSNVPDGKSIKSKQSLLSCPVKLDHF
ncbi:uncharacterized protein LOC123474311 isoform X3 [Daphnia magna]|uniref:uncharacterized protein LOC123474311 isoform X3 n=1 Tax=Daphnia magna TaxID=35525 RepID=UPI001E1BD5D9|nr:uncharacterized protein LOC123474311 isoform X3 [Daphnia magna]